MTDWCIIRTSAGRTLGLMASLSVAGIEAWTPRQILRKSKPGRAGRKPVNVEAEQAMLPGYLFVRAEHVRDLAAIRRLPASIHAPFSFFTIGGRIPLVADGDMEHLRRAEERALKTTRRIRRRHLVMGQRVSFTQGAFAGLSGVVQSAKGQAAQIVLDGGLQIKVASWHIGEDEIEQAHSAPIGAAA